MIGLVVCMGLQFVPFLFTYSTPDLPLELPSASRAAFEQAHDHLAPLIQSRMFRRGLALLTLVVVLLSGVLRWEERRFGHTPWRWPARLLLFVALFCWFRVTAYPFSYFAFMHDRAFDLTPMTGAQWWMTEAKGTLVPFIMFMLRCVLLFCLMAVSGKRWWWVAVWSMFLLFHVVPEKVSRTQPIDPVEVLTPLPEGEIRTQFEGLAEQTGRDLELVMVDESKRSRRLNMALTGRLGREYVLVTDTLLDQLTPAEARVMLAHELGHDVTRRFTVPARWALSFAGTLLAFWLVYRWYRRRAIPEVEIPTALVRLMLVSMLVGYVSTPLKAAVNRYQEREADAYAVELTQDPKALQSLLLTLAEVNLEPYDVPGWAFYLYGSTHPTLKQRLEAAERWK